MLQWTKRYLIGNRNFYLQSKKLFKDFTSLIVISIVICINKNDLPFESAADKRFGHCLNGCDAVN
jgi:hypothetical protein